jgi:hypothetical protein
MSAINLSDERAKAQPIHIRAELRRKLLSLRLDLRIDLHRELGRQLSGNWDNAVADDHEARLHSGQSATNSQSPGTAAAGTGDGAS